MAIRTATIGDYHLSLPIISKSDMQRNSSFSRTAIWGEIKAIRAADPTCGIIPRSHRFVSYGSIDELMNELVLYHGLIEDAFEQHNVNNERNVNNDNDNDNNNNAMDVDENVINGDDDEKQEELEPVPLDLLFQISSPNQETTGDEISSWFRSGENQSVANDFVKELGNWTQTFFNKFTVKKTVSIECRAYNEIVRRHLPSTWDPEKVTKCTWLGNQHKVLRKKAKSIATCVGSAHIIISFDWEKFMRNDAPPECKFRCHYAGPLIHFEHIQKITELRNDFEIQVGEFLASAMAVVKSSKATRLDMIGEEMKELENQKDEYPELDYYKKMDELRRERGLLLEAVDIQFDDNQPNDEQQNAEQQNYANDNL